MNYNYTLKYRTLEQLLADASMDLKTLDVSGKITPAELAKVALRVNYDLGLRVQMTKETIIEIEHNKAKLPDDFFVMNFALMCGSFTEIIIPPQGTHIEEVSVNTPLFPTYKTFPNSTDPCAPAFQCVPSVCLTECGAEYKIIQKVNTYTRHYDFSHQVVFKNSKFINCECPNLGLNWGKHHGHTNEAYIRDGFVFTNFTHGKMYINYQGQLVDPDGNLLVVDHPEINEYYEYAVKQRIIENLILGGENLIAQMQIIDQRLRVARNYALNIVNTPNFSEMQKLWVANRKAMYSKYYDMFKSYDGQLQGNVNNAV